MNQPYVHATQYTAYLPYGELLVDEHTSSEDLPYKFNGKELDEETGLYYYGARYMQPITSVWYGIDPLTEKYPNVSGYVYCAGNPIKYIDPTGMKIDPSSQKEWDRQKQKITVVRDKLQGKINELNAEAANNDWSAEKLARKIGNMQDRVSSLNQTISNLCQLEASTQVYSLSSGAIEEGKVTYSSSTGNIVINYGTTANFVHETTHAGQFESGDIAFDIRTGEPYGADVFDEISAYQAQFGYSPVSISRLTSSSTANSFADINTSWVQGLTNSKGAKIYTSGGSANTGVFPVNINTNRDGLIKAYPHIKEALSALPESFSLKQIPTIYYKRQ